MPGSWGERLGTDKPYLLPSSLLAFDFPAMDLSGLSPLPQVGLKCFDASATRTRTRKPGLPDPAILPVHSIWLGKGIKNAPDRWRDQGLSVTA